MALGLATDGIVWSWAAATAEWLCGVVGSSGSVTAVDINTVLLELVPAQNLAVRQLDVRAGQLPASSYDLVTCRAVLHQISEHAAPVLEQMAAAVKPGGWLLVQEPDFHLRANHGTGGLGRHLERLDRVGTR